MEYARKLIYAFALGVVFTSPMPAQEQSGADSVVNVVMTALTTDKVQFHGDVDSMLTHSDWEALAYWNKTDPVLAESIHEAVGDRYTFKDGKFIILFVDPTDPGRFGTEAKGRYERRGPSIVLLNADGDKVEELEIRYIDANYLVLEFEGMRLFLTHELTYGISQ